MQNKTKIRTGLSLTLAVLSGMSPGLTSCSEMSRDSAIEIIGALISDAARGAGTYGPTKDKEVARTVALIAGAIGRLCAADTAVRSRSEYRTSQEYVNANKEQMGMRIENTRKYNREISGGVAKARRENTKISRDEKKKLNDEVTRSLSLIDQDISNAKRARAEAVGADKVLLDGQIRELTSEKNALKRNRTNLYSIKSI